MSLSYPIHALEVMRLFRGFPRRGRFAILMIPSAHPNPSRREADDDKHFGPSDRDARRRRRKTGRPRDHQGREEIARAHGRAGPRGRVRGARGESRRPLAHLGDRSGPGHPAGFHPRALRGPRTRRDREAVHRPGDEPPHAGLRFGAGRLPGRPEDRGRGVHLRDRPVRDELHRPAAGRIRIRGPGGRDPRGIPGARSSSRATTSRPRPRNTPPTPRPSSRPSGTLSSSPSRPASTTSTSTRRPWSTSRSRRSTNSRSSISSCAPS